MKLFVQTMKKLLKYLLVLFLPPNSVSTVFKDPSLHLITVSKYHYRVLIFKPPSSDSVPSGCDFLYYLHMFGGALKKDTEFLILYRGNFQNADYLLFSILKYPDSLFGESVIPRIIQRKPC